MYRPGQLTGSLRELQATRGARAAGRLRRGQRLERLHRRGDRERAAGGPAGTCDAGRRRPVGCRQYERAQRHQRPRGDAAAVHAGRGLGDRRGAVRHRRRGPRAGQRARPGVHDRGRQGRRRGQDLEPRRGPRDARPGDRGDPAHRAGRPRPAGRPAAARARRDGGRRSRRPTGRPPRAPKAGTSCGCSSGCPAAPPRPAATSTTARCAPTARRSPGWASPCAASSTRTPAAASCGTPRTRSACGRWCRRSRMSATASIVDGLLDRYEERVSPGWPRLRSQVIHGDFALDNALLDDRDRVVGIIDFGDIVHSALATDLASSLSSVLRTRDEDDVFRAGRLLIDGFQSRVALEPVELELLADLLAARLCTIVSISAWRVISYPENAEYIQAWDPGSWMLINLFDRVGMDEVAARAGRRPAAGRQRRAGAPPPAGPGLGDHRPHLQRAGARAARRGAVAVRGRRPPPARRLQQRAGGRPLPPARDRGRRPPDADAEHALAVPVRAADGPGRAADRGDARRQRPGHRGRRQLRAARPTTWPGGSPRR